MIACSCAHGPHTSHQAHSPRSHAKAHLDVSVGFLTAGGGDEETRLAVAAAVIGPQLIELGLELVGEHAGGKTDTRKRGRVRLRVVVESGSTARFLSQNPGSVPTETCPRIRGWGSQAG